MFINLPFTSWMALGKFIDFTVFICKMETSNTSHRAPPSNPLKIISTRSLAEMSSHPPNHPRMSSNLIFTYSREPWFLLWTLTLLQLTTLFMSYCPLIVPYVDIKASGDGTWTNFFPDSFLNRAPVLNNICWLLVIKTSQLIYYRLKKYVSFKK